MVLDFNGKTVVVTGGANGIGLTTARLLRGYGADVWVLDLEREDPTRVAATFTSHGIVADVSDRQSLESAFRLIPDFDVLVANAGTVAFQPLTETKAVDWDRVLSVNLSGMFHCVQLAANRMKTRRRAP